ncbi:MAG: hypothetical protein BVN33_14780 [Proteobacteria bacterium ST_bin13]|nr:MAG: hypothetical protein BVN33_14780 [Proteobacteria bacterium ST_bin13]
MSRDTELLSWVSYSLSNLVETWQRAGVLTHDEVENIKRAVWAVVVNASTQIEAEESERLAEQTAEAL